MQSSPLDPQLLPEEVFPVVVIGAGLAGLTAALHLAERGITPLVLEADQRDVGGRISGGWEETFEHEGRVWSFPTEHGMHALWGGYDNMRATLDRFVSVELKPSPGEVWINRWGYTVTRMEAGSAVRYSWLPAPFHYLQLLLRPRFWTTITPLDFLSLPGFLFSVLVTAGFDPIREKIALDGLMMRDYFGGWTSNLKATFVGLGKNLLAAPMEEISFAAFVAAMRFFTLLNRSDWHPHFFPSDAHTALIQPMLDKLEALDGWVMVGTTAKALARTPNGWRVIVDDAARGGERSLEAAQVILALDPPATDRLLSAHPDTAAEVPRLRIPGGLRTTTARLWFTKTPTQSGASGMLTGDFMYDNFFWLDQLQPPFAAWREAVGGSTIELHLYGTDRQVDQPDKVLIQRALDEVLSAYPELRDTFIHGAIRRNSKTQSVFRIPTANSLHVRSPYPRIFACGDWIGHPTPSLWMERSCTTAIAAANEVLTIYGCEPYPILEPTPPEPLARWLGAGVYGLRRLMNPPYQWIRRSRR